MILATYRDTETTGREALTATLSALAHEPSLTRLRLVGLTRPEVERQLAAVTGARVSPEHYQFRTYHVLRTVRAGAGSGSV